MQKYANFIVKHKKIISIIALILLIPSIIGYVNTRTNYDILIYLPDDIETIKGQEILANDFNMGSFAMIVTENLKPKDILKLENKIKEVDSVQKVISIADVIGTDIPVDALPDEVKSKVYSGNDTVIMVTFSGKISEDKTMVAVNEIRNICDGYAKVGGMTSALIDTKELSDSEVAIYVLIAVILCLIILQLALDSYFTPFLLLINIGFAVIYNMGSNYFLGEISYITKAISAVLQLGVTMDFAIFLYHSYIEEKNILIGNKNNKESTKDINDKAMSIAIKKTMTSVIGSAITTIAGFLALCSMNLTLGKDIGIVMAKGVLFGLACAITILPSFILLTDILIEKTKHKPIIPQFKKLKEFNLKHYKAIIVIAIIILPFAIYGYKNTKVYYKLDSSLPDSLSSIEATHELKDNFGIISTELVLVDSDMESSKLKEMTNEIKSVEGIDGVISYAEIADKLPEEMLPNNVREIFKTEKYQLLIVNSKYEIATDELNNQINEINSIIKKYDENGILAGEGPLMNDLVKVSDHDFKAVNYFSLGIIFIIMIIVLKSASLPFILMLTIEFAIFINMGIPSYTNTTLPFIASIVIGTIQLGATIDYAILITTKYIANRKEGLSKYDSIDQSLSTSINSVFVSALCFFGATFGVGVYSKLELIGSLCTLMSRGAIISMIVVITLLPALLITFDKLICKTTKGLIKEREV